MHCGDQLANSEICFNQIRQGKGCRLTRPKFDYLSLDQASRAEGVVVVIDVLRAFTTAAYALDNGASRIFPVGTLEEAFSLQRVVSNSLIMGEVGGRKPEGFDFSNSPMAVSELDLSGKSLIQSTTAGTQGIVGAEKAQTLLAASFVVAGVTAAFLQLVNPALVSFIISGQSFGRDGDEDRACGEYIEALMRGCQPDPVAYTKRVMTSTVGRAFSSGQLDYLSQEDIGMSLAVSRFDFCLPVCKEHGRLVIKRGVLSTV